MDKKIAKKFAYKVVADSLQWGKISPSVLNMLPDSASPADLKRIEVAIGQIADEMEYHSLLDGQPLYLVNKRGII